MIVKRNRPKAPGVRAIVRRSRPAVGQRRRAIVRRAGVSVAGPPPPQGPGRIEQALAWRPGKRFIVASAAVAVLTVFVAAGAWAWTSPLFEVNNIKVEGNERIAAAEIANRADLLGERIYTADLGEAQRALYSLPLVSSVSIERVWPDTIRITVVERQAWGTWQQDLVNYTIDRDGVVIGTGTPNVGDIVIVSDEHGALSLGSRVDYQAVDSAAELYERLPRQLGTTVVEVRFLGPRGVQVTTADGQVAFLGDSGGMSYKLAVWAAIAAEAERKGIRYSSIDLRYGNRPVLQ
jgi:cell division protein FtsQ